MTRTEEEVTPYKGPAYAVMWAETCLNATLKWSEGFEEGWPKWCFRLLLKRAGGFIGYFSNQTPCGNNHVQTDASLRHWVEHFRATLGGLIQQSSKLGNSPEVAALRRELECAYRRILELELQSVSKNHHA